MYCPKCGTKNTDASTVCSSCAQALAGPAPASSVKVDNLGGLVPYKNSRALIAYYLGIFSLIPCLGLFLGPAAFILGLQGLKFYKLHPEAKGKTHALIGVWFGAITGLLNLVL